MGIETATLMAYATAATAAVSVYNAANQPDAPTTATQDPVKPPQPAKAPDKGAIASKNAGDALPGGPLSGAGGTFLTGSGGVDPSTLNLGKNTLLGQ